MLKIIFGKYQHQKFLGYSIVVTPLKKKLRRVNLVLQICPFYCFEAAFIEPGYEK